MLTDDLEHLSRLGVAPEGSLREDEIAVDHDLEQTPGRLHELHLGIRVFLFDLRRQTGGPGPVVSDDAILDADSHDLSGAKNTLLTVRTVSIRNSNWDLHI